MKKLYFKIITFGCRTNQAESRMIGESLIKVSKIAPYVVKPACRLGRASRGKQVAKIEKADIVIINTCAVTVKVEKEVRQMIRKVKRENPECFLVVTGCWINKLKIPNDKFKIKISNFAKALMDKQNSKLLRLIDLVVRNEEKLKIPEILKDKFNLPHIKVRPLYGEYRDKYFESGKTFIKIQDGCDNFCSYCIVPYLRGKSVSRPGEEILAEIKEKVRQGIKEVVLTGVDIADYRFNSMSS